MLLALFSDLQLLFERLLTRLNGGNSISLESFEILSPSSIHPLFLTLPGKYQEYSHCYFTILNHRKKGPVKFYHPAFLGIHRTLEQKEFLKFRKGFLRYPHSSSDLCSDKHLDRA